MNIARGTWERSEVHEALVTLYLRLNGYFTTGLILHSPEWGRNRTEIDCFAIRHPNHRQIDRHVATPQFLALREGEVDLLLCEVKSCPEELAFNEPLRTDCESLYNVLRWAGVFTEQQVQSVAGALHRLLQNGVGLEAARNGVVESGIRIRGLLCCPPCSQQDCGSIWCLYGSEILRFVNECFSPRERRETCSTRYNFRQWGRTLAPLVEYFKNARNPPTLPGLYEHLGVP